MDNVFLTGPKIKLQKKTVDLKTGSDVVVAKTVYISPDDPYNSIVFHKVADALGVNKFDRASTDVSKKITSVYNHLVNKMGDKTNEGSVIDGLYSFRIGNNMGWRDLVNHLYRTSKLEASRVQEEKELGEKWTKEREYQMDLLEESRKAKDMRSAQRRLLNDSQRGIAKAQVGVDEAMQRHQQDVKLKDSLRVRNREVWPEKEDIKVG